ncbi:ATP-binding protein [Avibacterium paragallinarum]|uniref:Aerobic respiration control sensor protein n=2 Tax=Avibacterium paragallinarum TaxID=728 RepID=A0A0F5EZZ0_AVIPA|nr:ATP-binding protein [Avibacterium paragallinarum]KAA6210068.1 response regulator [Avibacterium paragallinarum]KKB01955.1 ATPase [Avibacterium paragallinarum]POY46012.1 hybrid sensor histidine kinase/response regulator [Avibacterium paragallinarum]RZN59662.1 response regulator [Avibacterium paragallinarum]RZN60674.1 response regulator [Avibacterium paragallinarum]
MKNIKHFAQRYVDWVIRLGRVKFSLLGVVILAVLALCTQFLLSLCVVGTVYWHDVGRSVFFGLISAPFVIYFFTLLVEKLEKSRLELAKLVDNLRREVSERMIAERKLSVALNDLEQSSRNKTALMTTISHELRTPLNGIIGLSRILLDSPLNPEQQNYLKTINMSAVSLGHIFSDIIDLEKIDAHKIELNRKETDFYAFLNDIANFATLMAEQNHLKFELQYEPNLPQWIYIDNARLSQILWNLINNAVKFTEKGVIRLRVSQVGEQTFAFAISDTGIGIAQAELEHIFAMYYRVKSKQYQHAGSGIGLAVSKTIANLMGGDLTVQSAVGKGSVFTLQIQAEIVSKPLEYQHYLPHQLRILLIEDIEVNIVVAKSILEKLGYQVDVAMTGKQAIEKFEQNDYDLLLIDIQLPDMSGFDIAQQLRQNYENDHYDYLPPLIALTANVMHDKQDYLQQGMDDILRKPLSLDELTQCLYQYFADDLTQSSPPPSFVPHQAERLSASYDSPLDFPFLNELMALLGKKTVKNNTALFEQQMPDYIAELNIAYKAYKNAPYPKEPLAYLAHKIKGAAGSVGLKRIQHLAASVQEWQSPDWEAKIDDWIAQLNEYWQQDLKTLMDWLSNADVA